MLRAFVAILTMTAALLTPAPVQAAPPALTNLAHIDWLGASVTPPRQAGHTTYRLDREPAVGVLWTYADRNADGTYRLVGGGRYDPATNTWSQGAFNADDIARAAVVYLRHWRATGTASSRVKAYQLLRGLTYLQTASGPDAGNVVLWMQPDGTLNRVADPPDTPAPSDSADSYWLARTLWALGEGYAAFRRADPAFAAFLRGRLLLSLSAVERQPLSRYGQYLNIDGVRVPAWLITEGADATGEALIGLAAYVRVTGDARARTTMRRLAEGVAAMRAGTPYDWPFGAVLPWARSRAVWHAWGGLAPAGLARAGVGLDAARSDAASFTPHLLIAAGPENGWLPAPTDRVQIAYGAQSRVESLLAVAADADRPGLRPLAGVAAAWFFGANPAGEAMYDPATGRTFDGVDGSGVVNRNSGAESTIHGLLAMLALDADPSLAAIARTARVEQRRTWTLVEAESGRLAGDASVYTPPSAWTGESLWSGGAGVRLGPGATLTLDLPHEGRLMPVVELSPGAGTTRWGPSTVDHGAVGPQGDSPAPGLLAVRTLHAASGTVTATATGTALVDAVLVQPTVEWLVLGGGTGATALVRSFASAPRLVRVPVRGTVTVFDSTGRVFARYPGDIVFLPPGGFALVRR